MVNEEELISRSQTGDLGAFDQLVILYQRRIFGFVCKKTNNYADAEEIVQNTLLQCFINLACLKKAASFGAWLFRICSHCISQYYNTEKRVFPVIITDVDAFADPGACGQQWQEYAAMVSPAMDKLTSEQEEVIRLRYFAGLSYAEISLLCQISVSLVKSRLHEARAVLKKKIPLLSGQIHVPHNILKRNKEIVMRKLDLIQKGAFVIRALSLETQLRLCRLAREGTRFDEPLLEVIGRIKFGREFVKGYDARLMMDDLIWIFNYSWELQMWIIDNLEESDPALAEEFKRKTFVLDDLVLIEPAAVAKVLEKTPDNTILTAMLSSSVQLKKYLISFYPLKKQQELLLRVPVLITDNKSIEMAQFEVLRIICQLTDEKVIQVMCPPDPAEAIKRHLQMQKVEV